MGSSNLVKRWDGLGRPLALVVLEAVREGQPFDGLGLTRHDGRLDLRGIPLAPLWKAATPEYNTSVALRIEDAAYSGIDFSGADLTKLASVNTTWTDCLFEGSRMRSWYGSSTVYENCSFRRTDLRDAYLGQTDRVRYSEAVDCDFSRANLRYASGVSGTFLRCIFEGPGLSKNDFHGSFVECKFSGKMVEVQFFSEQLPSFDTEALKPSPCVFEYNDLSDAEMTYVSFRKFTLDTCVLPSDSATTVRVDFLRAVREYAEYALAGDESPEAQAVLLLMRLSEEYDHPNRKVGVWSMAELEYPGADPEAVADMLRWLDHQCSKHGVTGAPE